MYYYLQQSLLDLMDSSGPLSSNSVNEGGSQQYNPHPIQVPVSNFVSIKLYGETNYNLWKTQMMCLLEYHDMVDFIDGTIRNPDDDDYDDGNKVEMTTKWNKSKDTLVKGWIFGTLSEDVLGSVLDLQNAYRVWEKLKDSYDNSRRVQEAELPTKKEISIENKERVAEGKYMPLRRAIERGDWNIAQLFFNMDRATLTAKINHLGDTPLHLAVQTCQNLQFVENLIKEIEPGSLPTLVAYKRQTTLHRAAIQGNTKAAKMLVEKNPRLLFIADETDYLPIHHAVFNSEEKTVRYLLEACKSHIHLSQNDGYKNPFEGNQGSMLLYDSNLQGFTDISYELICDYPNLAISEDKTVRPLLLSIVDNEDLYFSTTPYNSYERFIYSHVPIEKKNSENDNEIPDIENPEKYSTKFITKCKRSCFYLVIKRIYVKIWEATLLQVPHIKRLQQDRLKHKKALMILERICEKICTINNEADIFDLCYEALNLAVQQDNHEAVKTIIRFYPDALWIHVGLNFSQRVAKYRSEMVLKFLEERAGGGSKIFPRMYGDADKNNILHLAAQLAPTKKLNVVSGAALQMQKEVRWYKRIENFMPPSRKKERNKGGQTPIMLFREEHKNLRKEGEEWMKKTSDSYTITAALIITIVFAAAITVPGGNNQNTGKPIYTTNASFIIFAIADAISLFTATTALLLFLSILTARYHENDFLYKLPKRLILGLVMLFLSVTSMMVAFGATLYIMFGRGKEWILIPIAALACLPIASYVILQYPLLHELVSSTYGDGIYSKRNDRKNK